MNTESNFKGKTNYLPMLSERDVAWCRGVCLWSQLFWKSGEEWWWLWHPVTSIWEGKKGKKRKRKPETNPVRCPLGLSWSQSLTHTLLTSVTHSLSQMKDLVFGRPTKMCVLMGWLRQMRSLWHAFPLYPIILVPTLHLSVQLPSNPPILYAVALRSEAFPLMQVMEFSSSSFHLHNETVSPGYSIWWVW